MTMVRAKSDSRRMQECARSCGVSFHRLATNAGKGAAVYEGWDLDHESEWLGLVDADGSIPPYEVLRVLSMLRKDNVPDALFASRCKILGRTVRRSWLRHLCGRVFATLVATVTRIPVYDSQCGFKLGTARLLRVGPRPSARKAVCLRRRASCCSQAIRSENHRGAHRLVRRRWQQIAFPARYIADAGGCRPHAEKVSQGLMATPETPHRFARETIGSRPISMRVFRLVAAWRLSQTVDWFP